MVFWFYFIVFDSLWPIAGGYKTREKHEFCPLPGVEDLVHTDRVWYVERQPLRVRLRILEI